MTPTLETLVESISFAPLLHFRFGFGTGFAVDIDGTERAPLYVAGGAPAWLRFEDQPSIEMRDGDVVFLPHGGCHRVFNDAAASAIHLDEVFAREMDQRGKSYALDINGTDSVWSGSCFLTRDLASNPLMCTLPKVLHLRAVGNQPPWLGPTVTLMRWMSDLRQGASVGMAEMSNVLIRHMTLAHVQRHGDGPTPTLDADTRLRDRRLLNALNAIHTQPAHDWTLEALAADCHMSRTAFAVRFQEQTGQTPMKYLARWRIHLAARLLREERMSLDQAAERVGYSSGAVLARAYKRLAGFAPSQARGQPAQA